MKVTILGAGLMGAQIGAEYLAGGHEVALVTRSDRSAAEALARASDAVDLLVDAGLARRTSDLFQRIRVATSIVDGVRGASLVVESLPEDIDLKVEALSAAASAAPNAILASNTSSLSITEVGKRVGSPERLLGTHYWNPPTLMPLVEVVRGNSTSDTAVDLVTRTLRAMGKEPVPVRDVPGFVWNRLQFALLREAASLVADGVTDAATIDLIVRRGLGRRLSLVGPFETMALGGRETFQKIARQLWPELSAVTSAEVLNAIPTPDSGDLASRKRERDRALAELLRRDRS